MAHFSSSWSAALAITLIACLCAVLRAHAEPPAIFTINPSVLEASRVRAGLNDASVRPALDALLQDADRALKIPAASVMDKPEPGPSGDKHDYVSYAPYFWPNPDTKDGLPYIRKDGQRNRELMAKGDAPRFEKMLGAVNTLALAYYYTGKESYGQHAAELLRAWFLNPQTRMNPNFTGAQAVRGKNDGRGTGLIEFAGLPGLVDALGLLKPCPAWTEPDQTAMKAWMTDFARWLAESKQAADERKAANNHGVYFDTEEASLLLFLHRDADVVKICQAFKKRIDSQIEPDGSLPRELSRADGWGYSVMNVQGMLKMCRLADRVGVDLWHYESPTGGSIRKALDYIAVYADPTKTWPHNQHNAMRRESLISPLIVAESAYGAEPYRRELKMLPGEAVANDRENLFVEHRAR